MILFVQMFFIIVTDNIEMIDVAQICREFREGNSGGNRARRVSLFCDRGELFRNYGKAFHIWAVSAKASLFLRLVCVVVSSHGQKALVVVRVIWVVDLIADGKENDTWMVAVAPDLGN